MKKTLLLIALMLCCATTIFAQNNKISYQAVVRDTENRLVANKTVERLPADRQRHRDRRELGAD